MKQFDITQIQDSLAYVSRRKHRIEKTAFLTMISAAALISFFVFFLLDYMTDFPWPVRIALSVIIFAYFAVYLPVRKKKYFIYRKDFVEIARETELCANREKKGGFNSILVSAVEFAENASVFGSEELKGRTVETAHSTEFDPKRLKLHDAGLLKLALKTLSVFLIIYSAWGVLGYKSMGVFFARACGLSFQYPTKTKIVKIEYPANSPRYKSISILVKAAGVVPSEGTMSLSYDGESSFTVPLQKEVNTNDFVCVVKEPEKSFSFRVNLGDAVSLKQRVKVVRPPYVVESTIKVVPPPYTGQAEKQFAVGNFEALENSGMDIFIVPDRKVKTCILEIRDKEQENKRELPMLNSGNGYAAAKIALKNPAMFAIKLIDEDGVENEDRIFYSISVIQDRLPLVKLDKPAHGAYYAPVSTLNWQFKASDDFGISNAVLHYVINTKNENGDDKKIREGDIEVKGLNRGDMEAVFSGNTSLLELRLTPGLTVAFQAVVRDNCESRGADDAGRSAVNTINIVTPEELRAALDEEMLNLGKMVDDIKADMKHQIRILEMYEKKEGK